MKLRRNCALLGAVAALGGSVLPEAAHATIYHYYYDAAGRAIGITGERSQLKSYRYDNDDNRSSALLQIPTGPSVSQKLTASQSIFQDGMLTSASGAYTLTLDSSGNLILKHSGSQIWSSGSTNQAGSVLIMQGDGNLCLYDPQYNYLWGTGTSGAGVYLVLQDDGNLVIYNGAGSALWASNTAGR